MKCPICHHGHTRPERVTVTLDHGQITVVFKDVPAEVCENCGEQFVDEQTTATLLRQANDAAAKGVQLEVRSFAA
jgi:YgiT-type zinc finger domain-containing protein